MFDNIMLSGQVISTALSSIIYSDESDKELILFAIEKLCIYLKYTLGARTHYAVNRTGEPDV